MSKKEIKKEEVVNEELQQEFEEAKKEFNEMTEPEETPKKKKNYTAVIVIAAILLTIGLIFGVTKMAKNYKQKTYGDMSTTVEKDEKAKEVRNNLSTDKKEIIGVKTDEKKDAINEVIKNEEKKNSTDAYKQYEKMSDKQKAAQTVIPSKEKSPYKTVDEVKDVIKYDEQGLPNKFNLNNTLTIKVPDQKSYDLSWAFASIKTAETNYALHNNNKMPDLSEMHLDYFSSSDYYGYRELHGAGGFYNFEEYLVSNGGLVTEENMPYTETKDSSKVTNNKNDYYVNSTIYYPDIYYLEYDENSNNIVKGEMFNDYISLLKYHLVHNGALYTTILKPTPGASYFNSKTNALYNDGNYDDWYSYYSNRQAATIVGYDDTYSKDNFNASLKPSKDGAFIAMISEGDKLYDKGYIYISYEDMVVTSDVHGVISTSIDEALKVSDVESPIIRDQLLKNYNYAAIEINGEKYIPQIALNIPAQIDLSNMNLTEDDISELNVFEYIQKLDLSNNNLSDFDYLINNLWRVEELDVSNNNFTYIPSDLPDRNIYYINLEGNNVSDITGLRDLNVRILDISSDNYVTGFSALDNLFAVDIKNTDFDIRGLENKNELSQVSITNTDLSETTISLDNLYSFKCDNCRISSLDNIDANDVYTLELPNNTLTNLNGINKYKDLSVLNVSNNTLADISGVKDADKLVSLDISFNPDIKDYTPLKTLYEPNDYPTYEELVKDWAEAPSKDKVDIKYNHRDEYEYLNVSNNKISDISLFNELDVYNLDLSGNEISDLSSFNNENIMEINLAYNKGLSNIDKLSKVRGLNVSSNNITDISDLSKFNNLTWVNLSNNDIQDITPLNKLGRLSFVSLENNSNQVGILNNKSIDHLNIANCGLESLDNYNIENISLLNISNNKNLETKLSKLKDNTQEYFNLIAKGLDVDYDEIKDLNTPKRHVYLDGLTITYKAKKDGNKVIIEDNNLANTLFEYTRYGMLKTESGFVGRLGKTIDLEYDDGKINAYIEDGAYYNIKY